MSRARLGCALLFCAPCIVDEALFLFFQQPVDLFDEFHQLVWVLLVDSLLTELSPTCCCFPAHNVSLLCRLLRVSGSAKSRHWKGVQRFGYIFAVEFKSTQEYEQ